MRTPSDEPSGFALAQNRKEKDAIPAVSVPEQAMGRDVEAPEDRVSAALREE